MQQERETKVYAGMPRRAGGWLAELRQAHQDAVRGEDSRIACPASRNLRERISDVPE